MSDVERSMLHCAILNGAIHTLVSRGITSNLFSATDGGQECKAVFEYSVTYMRAYGKSPPLSAIQRLYPEWRGSGSVESLDALCDEFLDLARKRAFDDVIFWLANAGVDRSNWGQLDSLMLEKARDLAALVPTGEVGRFSDDFERQIAEYEEEKNRGVRPGMPLGIPIIDEVTEGIRSGWLVTTAGFSGLGKTNLSLWASLNLFESDRQVLFLSAEMAKREVLDRLHTMVMHFRHRDLVNRRLSDMQVKQWRDVARVYKQASGEINIVDRIGGATIDRVHAEITRYRPDVAVVDYVQRLRGTRNSMARWEGLEEITNELKTIAMDTDTAILMVSQDGRSAADEGSTRTNMGGSVSVYQAADMYLGLMQDDIMRSQNKMRVKLLKFRHGPLAEVDMTWSPSTGEFGLWDESQAFQKQPLA